MRFINVNTVWIATLVAVIVVGVPREASTQKLVNPSQELVIGTKEAPPFAMKRKDGSWSGISIELWQRIANQAHFRYRFVESETVQSLLDSTADGSFDVAIAALTVTASRQEIVDFAQPFFNTGLGVAVPIMESVWTSILRILLSFGFVQAVLVLLAIAMGVGALIWILERRRTAHFSGGARGLASSFWWSTIAMTQAGAAHNAPATLPGRIVATAWMIASVIAITIFTAGLTSSLTRRELQGAVHSINDLRSVRVGAVAKSSTIDYLDRQRIAHQVFADVIEGLTALRTGSVDAFVYDKPLLTWTVRQDFPSTIRVLDITFGSQLYAIALPKGSPMRSMLDIAVLRQIEDEWWQQILFVYLGRNS